MAQLCLWNWPGFRLFIPEKDPLSFAAYAMNLNENNTKQKRKKGGRKNTPYTYRVFILMSYVIMNFMTTRSPQRWGARVRREVR